jgi:predicted ATPase/DNA-binding SARP family transcriptional activator
LVGLVDTGKVWVGLLGPLDVRLDGTPIAVPAGKSATLLAALALDAGRPVTVDALADRIWREEPPKDVRASLQTHVHRLRRLVGSSRIRTTASGYELEGADVDVPRFRRLSAAAAGSDDPEEARALLDAALQLWRGDPLAGLPGGAFDRDEVPHLVEERLEALKRRIDLDLAAGRHADVVPSLRDLTSRHPLREPFWQQLIVALSAGGRQPEAIEAYHDVRGRLRDELGVDPSPDLQRLFHGLLTLAPAAEPAPSRLPIPPTRLIGREDDLARLIDVVRRTRLVTAVGPGGVGKTRLALEAARSIAGDFTDGVTFVPLASVRDPALFADAVANAMSLRWESGRPARDVVAEHLAQTWRLLLLDNFEHVTDAAPEVSELLAACPHLHVLVTSRAGLRVRGEQRFPIAPLDLDAAVELFCELASAARPSIRLDGRDAEAVTEICRRLDGLPLALELIAARIAFLEPRELLARLDPVLPMLTGGPRDLPDRQRTMSDTITWSYDLLTAEERAVFRHLAVFEGGWTVADATAVCGPSEDQLAGLLEMSLVVREGGERFTMLETIRAYALEQLAGSGEECAIRERHAARFSALAARAAAGLRGPDQIDWMNRLSRDHHNLRAVLRWLLEQGMGERAVEIGWSIWLFWFARDKLEGWRWMRWTLERRDGLDPAASAKALFVAGAMRYQMRPASSEDPPAEAAALLDESIALAGQAGADEVLRDALEQRGFVAGLLGEAGAEEYFARCEALCRKRGDRVGAAWAILGAASIAWQRCDYPYVLRRLDDAATMGGGLGPPRLLCLVLYYRAQVAMAVQDDDRADAPLQECASISDRVGETWILVRCLVRLASLACRRRDPRRAARLLAAAHRLGGAVDAELLPQLREMRDRCLADTAANLGPDAFAAAWEEGMTAQIAGLLAPSPELRSSA